MIRHAGLLALLGAAACWGLTVTLLAAASRGLGTSTMTVVELTSALAVLAAVCVAGRVRVPRPSATMALAGGLEPGLAYVLLNAGIARTSGAHASLIIGTEAATAVLLAALVARRRPRASVCVGLLLATGGAAAVAGGDGGGASLGGDLLVAAGVVAAAAYVVTAQRLSSRMSPLVFTTQQFAVGTLVTVPLLLLSGTVGLLPSFDWAPTRYVGLAAASGVIGSTVAFGLYNWALHRVHGSQPATCLALIPVFGVLFSALFLGDAITGRTVVAAAAVVLGVGLAASGDSARDAGEPASEAPALVDATDAAPWRGRRNR